MSELRFDPIKLSVERDMDILGVIEETAVGEVVFLPDGEPLCFEDLTQISSKIREMLKAAEGK